MQPFLDLILEQIQWIFSGIGLAIISGTYYIFRRRINNNHAEPQLSITRSEIVIRIEDAQGAVASLHKTVDGVSLRDDLDSIVEYVIFEGALTSTEVIGATYHEASRKTGVGVQNRIFFERPLVKNQDFHYELKRKLRDTFRSQEEYWEFEISYPTQLSVFTIEFPAERPPKRFWGEVNQSENSIRIQEQPRKKNGPDSIKITWVIKNPILSYKYTIYWIW